MKKYLTLFTFACTSLFASDSQAVKPIKFSIHEKEYRYSNHFELSQEEGASMGIVSKKRFAYLHISDNFEVYDSSGAWEATGVNRVLTLGSLFSWATEIDVYDPVGKKIGMIDGQVFTTTSARFSIYNYDDTGRWTLAGIAFMDNEKKSFSIVDPKNDKRIISVLRRIFVPNLHDHWECKVFFPDAIDIRTMKIFAAFAVDHQEFFRADT